MNGESRLFRLLHRHWWLALLVMGFSFVAFGIASLNLLDLLQANLRFLAVHGVDAVREGGLAQLVERHGGEIELLAARFAALAAAPGGGHPLSAPVEGSWRRTG